MAEDQNKNNPSYECRAYGQMQRAWKIVRDVCEGTLHLREDERSQLYLPMEPAEDSKDFSIRRARAILFNALERTLHGLVGMVFRKEPTLGLDVPEVIRGNKSRDKEELGVLRGLVNAVLGTQSGNDEQINFLSRITGIAQRYREWKANNTRPQIEGLAENIDNAGTHWTVLAKEVFTNAMRDGHSFILVDMPPMLSTGSSFAGTPDYGDEKAANRRPYWLSYCADDAINWITGTVNGRTKLLQITFREVACEPDGEYGETEVVRYRVLRPGQWTLYKEVKRDGKTAYDLIGGGPTSLDEIPVSVIYARKTGYLRSKPPLLDLALMNVCHYQKYSDYSIYLHIASRPILWFKGRKDNPVEVIGPYTAFDVDAQFGEVAFAETTGAALGAARQDLQDLKDQMAALGLSIIAGKAPQPGTATEDLLDHVQEESDLATAARSLKDGLERALYFTARYLDPKAITGGSVELGATIQELTLNAQDLQSYSNLVALGQLSLETMWAILARAGRLPADFDAEQEKQRIEAAAETAASLALKKFDRGE